MSGELFHLEKVAKLLISLEAIFSIFSKCTLKSLDNQADFDSAIRRFDPSRPSHAVLRFATVHNLRLTGPEIRAFRAFNLVSRLRLSQSPGRNGGKSLAYSGKIPVLRRLLAETGSITTAARGGQSQLVRFLTTRSVVLIEAGDLLLERLGPALTEIESALDPVNVFRDKPAGTLRLNVPLSAARLVLPAIVPAFLSAYPDIRKAAMASGRANC
jgi:hypothetical protein